MVSSQFTQQAWRVLSPRYQQQLPPVLVPVERQLRRLILVWLPSQPTLVARRSWSLLRTRSRHPTRQPRSRAATTPQLSLLAWWWVSLVWPLWPELHSSSTARRSRMPKADSAARPAAMAGTRSHPPCPTPALMETTWPSAVKATAASTMITTFLAASCRSVANVHFICNG